MCNSLAHAVNTNDCNPRGGRIMAKQGVLYPVNAFRSPTKEQLAFCQELGISVPDGASRKAVADLISGTTIRFVLQMIKENGLRIGDVISRCCEPESRYVLAGFNGNNFRIYKLPRFTYVESPAFVGEGSLLPGFILIAHGPESFIHSLAVQSRKAVLDNTIGRKKLHQFITKRIVESDRLNTEYGVYWRVEAVEKLTVEFEAANLERIERSDDW